MKKNFVFQTRKYNDDAEKKRKRREKNIDITFKMMSLPIN